MLSGKISDFRATLVLQIYVFLGVFIGNTSAVFGSRNKRKTLILSHFWLKTRVL